MRHGLSVPPFGTFGDVHLIVDLAHEAEAAGWDGFFLWDHILYATDVPFVDPWVAMAAMGMATTTIRFGPMVTPLPRRRPWKVAREAVTLDHLSGGRFTLGIGLGTDFWREYRAFGEPATDDQERAALVDESLEIITKLWSGQPVTFDGRKYQIDEARFLPTPVQQPRIPIWCGALLPLRNGPARRAARCDGVFPFPTRGEITADDVARLRDRMAELRDNDAPFDIVVPGAPRQAKAMEAAGAAWLVVGFGPTTTAGDIRSVIAAGPPS